jgi:hypothetical protein
MWIDVAAVQVRVMSDGDLKVHGYNDWTLSLSPNGLCGLLAASIWAK